MALTSESNRDGFTTAAAARALASTCASYGLDASEARLVRLGENAIYVLPRERLVLRIARSTALVERVERELQVARWLAGLDFPAVRVAESLTQPHEVDGRLVTFWHELPSSGDEPSFEDLGTVLRELHALQPPPFPLPGFDPFIVVPQRLDSASGVAEDDVAFLGRQLDDLQAAYAALEFPTPFGLIHGDAHRGNLLMADGKPVLLDFEVVAHGPREWDLTPTAMSVDRFGVSQEAYDSFATAYGRDVREWPGYGVLRGVRELTMTTWLMQIVGESRQYADEFRLRVDSMRKGRCERRWHPF